MSCKLSFSSCRLFDLLPGSCLIWVVFQYRQFSRLPRLRPSSSTWLFVCLVIPVLLAPVIRYLFEVTITAVYLIEL
ncbi:uncharacterized protein B0J16DRAFT_326865 [Fusarium flagelliforme]|uniref:uncharacterized protein n=1 Tax=Fusarium flagelliforme TaxID=2675880 RepID=UPI001E8D2D5F|nr:uncharacterized protein B0J16DRAFT_326865 [Fusarium flagelliforme]KAH7196873.1 hypothetical protein B0J16DRAFT_326865 [Fusarium flagelliforme]